MDLFNNYPLLSAFVAVILAQLIKIMLNYVTNRSWDFHLLVSTGGLPSSHSAAVTALSTAVAIQTGVHSTLFAVSTVFSIVVMFDAAGVRRHAGEQAAILNRLIEEFQHLFQEIKISPGEEKRIALKELLGHRPSEVVVGGILGVAISLAMYYWIFY